MAPAFVFGVLMLQEKSAIPDRSGETMLKRIFEVAGRTRDVHLGCDYYSLDSIPRRYNESRTSEIWLGRGGRFRFVTSSNFWGGGKLVVSDGMAMLSDELSDDSTIRIEVAPKSLHLVDDREPWLYVFAGSSGYRAFVETGQAITLKTDRMDGFVDFTSKSLGRVVLHYRMTDAGPFPTMYELFQAPWWADDPGDGSMPFTRASLRVLKVSGIPLSLFSVKPPPGKQVADQRAMQAGR